VILPARLQRGWRQIDDSKKLSAERRATFAQSLQRHALVGIGWASVAEIDRMNILHASLLAMCRAIEALPCRPALALVDGNRCPPDLPCDGVPVVGGDGLSLSIAAASIVAKTARDAAMARLHADYPAYGWNTNQGYGTAAHCAALDRHGPTPHHRRSFSPVARGLAERLSTALDVVEGL